jgi:nucleotide-binding universal stress UspA family protein
MYKRILVAVGDDPQMDAPVAYAIALAAQNEAELWLLRVLTLPLAPGVPDMAAYSARAMGHVMQVHEQTLAWAMEAAVEADVAYTATMRWGAVPDTIMQTAAEADCDVIVVGAPACPGWQRLFGGYLARTVLAKAPRPVLVVTRPPPALSYAPLWSRLLVVHDGSPGAGSALEYALALAHEALLDICVLRLGVPRPPPPDAPHSVTHYEDDFASMLTTRTAIAGVDYEVVLAPDYHVGTVIETAAEYGCDVIGLGTRPGSPWQRLRRRHLARALIAATDLPVLSIPPCP